MKLDAISNYSKQSTISIILTIFMLYRYILAIILVIPCLFISYLTFAQDEGQMGEDSPAFAGGPGYTSTTTYKYFGTDSCDCYDFDYTALGGIACEKWQCSSTFSGVWWELNPYGTNTYATVTNPYLSCSTTLSDGVNATITNPTLNTSTTILNWLNSWYATITNPYITASTSIQLASTTVFSKESIYTVSLLIGIFTILMIDFLRRVFMLK